MKARALGILVLVLLVGAVGASIAWAVGQGGAGWGGGPMMGSRPSGGAQPVRTMSEARQQAERFAQRLGLRAGEVMQFTRNFYVELTGARGRGATEVLVDPASGAVSLEYGPAMMWNTRYGMMRAVQGGMMGRYGRAHAGGMMGGGSSGMMGGAGGYGGMMGGVTPSAGGLGSRAAQISPAQAERIAATWLGANQPVAQPGPAEAFPGYYTLHTLRSGRITGMISVNASSGAVMPHWWHGDFVAMTG
jgi:hypothetical protein